MLVFEFVSDSAFVDEDDNPLMSADLRLFVLRLLRYLMEFPPPPFGHYTRQSHCRAPGLSIRFTPWVSGLAYIVLFIII